jgi:hypothetical protein
MEYCSLNDAFPATDSPPPIGCRGGQGSQSAAKTEKKKAKRCKAPRMEFVDTNFDEAAAGGNGIPSNDPDRQVERTEPPQAFKHGAGVSEAYGGIQPLIEPVAPAAQNSATTRAAPKWFGGFVDSTGGITESFTPYTGTVSEKGQGSGEVAENSQEYMLQPAFNKSLQEFGGADKPTGPILPLPNLSDRWKPMTSGGQTAFLDKAPATGGQGTMTDAIDIKKKLDRIFERLDQIEQQRSCTDNNNTEVGMFVISGVFVLFFMDLLVRKTSTSLRLFNA